jgi:hypothetical protein
VQYGFAKFIGLKKCISSQSEPVAQTVLQRIVDAYVVTPAVKDVLTDLSESGGSLRDVAKRLADLENSVSGVAAGSKVVSGVLSAAMPPMGERILSGVPWLDSRIGRGRGPSRGSSIGIIAPQRNGKTTLGIELAIAQATMGKDALLVLAEEGITRAMKRRIVACAIGVPTTVIEDCNDDPVKAMETVQNRELAKKRWALVDRHLHVYDMIARPGTFDSIGDVISQVMSKTSNNMSYVYIDWAGLLADKLMGGEGGRKFHSKEEALKTIGMTVTNWAAVHNINVAISQQMAPALISESPTKDRGYTCAADCKGFTETFKYVIVINPADKNGFNVVSIPKCRDDEMPGRFVLKLRGELGKFEDVSDRYIVEGRNITYVRKGDNESQAS